ncbi:MAG: two-component system chemotaxis sensor kinase CheA [Enterobacterales bacterium]|jgi:two-component system chemotaxis sensor kinase CheA
MSFEADEELLEDFLIEAGEILELLSEQLVELENNPEDQPLLNAIFRGFHTIKGGAGFLNLTTLVEVSHITENVFDLLRNHERKITAELMDAILQSLDTVNDMFKVIKAGDLPDKADDELLAKLGRYSIPESEENDEETAVEDTNKITLDSDDVSDDDFEALLDQIHGKGASPSNVKPEKTPKLVEPPSAMTDDDFEALLDELHGAGNKPGESTTDNKPKEKAKAKPKPRSKEIMDDDDFDSLLDEIHGKGKGPTEAMVAPKAEKKVDKKVDKKVEVKAKVVTKEIKAPVKKAKPGSVSTGETTVRVDTKRLDDIMNLVGELVLVRNRMSILTQQTNDENLVASAQNLDLVTASLQGAVMKTRMQPIKKVFGRFPRVVRDLARTLKKEVDLVLEGEDTDLDKNLVEALADPLVHLVRNSVDHGVEMPEVREQKGKERCGKVILAASQEGDHILLTIKDDGAGMDPELLRGIAVKKKLMDSEAAARLNDNECFNLIFAPGFSTKTEISDVSGRGVGMDVVKTKISSLNGIVDITSELGVGTTISIKVPLTLAIMPTLMVVVGKQTFALPLASVSEIFHLDLTRTNVVDGQQTIIVREKAIPLFYLEHWLIKGADRSRRKEKGHVVIYQAGSKRVGFVVDSLVGQEEVVIKALGKRLQGTPGMSGATITSDGGIALILDVPSLLAHYSGHR